MKHTVIAADDSGLEWTGDADSRALAAEAALESRFNGGSFARENPDRVDVLVYAAADPGCAWAMKVMVDWEPEFTAYDRAEVAR